MALVNRLSDTFGAGELIMPVVNMEGKGKERGCQVRKKGGEEGGERRT